MRIRFPFLYNALYRANEQHPVEHGGIRGEWAEIEVQECDEADTTLACQVEGYGPSGVPYLVEVRKIGGGYYRPKLSVFDNPYTPSGDGWDRLTATQLGTVVPLVHSQHIRPSAGTGADAAKVADRYHEIIGVIEAQPDTRDMIQDNLNQVLANHGRAAANLVIIDGMVWERCHMPSLVVDLNCQRPKVVVAAPAWYHAAPPKHRSFPVGMSGHVRQLLEEASADNAYLNSLIVRGVRPEWKAEEIELPDVVYHDPSMTTFPWTDAMDVVEKVFSSLPSNDFRHYSREYIFAWVELRDALEMARSEMTPQSVERLIETWKLATAAAEAEGGAEPILAREDAISRLFRRHSLGFWSDVVHGQALDNCAAGPVPALGRIGV